MRRIKKVLALLAVLLLALPCSAPAESAGAPERPAPILCTYYRQAGWGDSVQVGYVDTEGGLWLLTGNDSDLRWLQGEAEQLEYLRSYSGFTRVEQLGSDALFDLKSLVLSVTAQEGQAQSAADDAGIEASYAIRYDRDDHATSVLLGVSGDAVYENTTPDAQALYAWLRAAFPQVTSYAGKPFMGPAGFTPVSLRSFCGLDGVDLAGVKISGGVTDCEVGFLPLDLTAQDEQEILDLITNGMVTGKANATMVTGGTKVFHLEDRAGNWLCDIELYEGLLVRSDGMYYLK